MKPSRLHSALRLTLFLMLITSFSTAVAYDFESGGIYYNITSPNTVEVTYRDTDYGSYTGNVEIPRSVSNNNKTYAVTAIGDSAFYYSSIESVIIPETVLSIGNDAFSDLIGVGNYNYDVYDWKEIISITCLSTTPPVLKGILGDNYLCHGLPAYCVTEFPTLFVLYVPLEALGEYKNSGWSNFFDFICYIGAGKTSSPKITIIENDFDDVNWCRNVSVSIEGDGDLYMNKLMFGGLNYFDENNWYFYSGWDYIGNNYSYSFTWGEGDFANECGSYGYTNYMLRVFAFAHEDGKLPSNISAEKHDHPIANYTYWTYSSPYPHDVEIDGIWYNFHGTSLEVVPNVSFILSFYFNENGSVDSYRESDLNNNNLPDVILPSKIIYNGSEYEVTSIKDYAFGYGYYDDVIEFPDLSIWGGYSASGCYINSCSLNRLIIPNSVKFIGNAFNYSYFRILSIPVSASIYSDCFLGCTIDNLYLTDEGEWCGCSLDTEIQHIEISSRVTAIPGMKVNPREVYCYAKVPPTCDENTFTDYTGTLHVPESSLAAYFTAPYWCNFANIVGDAVELQSISINKDSAELLIGEQINLNATLHPANANAEAIQWKSSNPSIATVTSDGVVTAKALGECDIIATCLDKQATCHVKVVEQVVTITLDQHHASLLPNHILTLTPTVSPASTPLAVTSSNPSVAAARLVNGVVQVVGVLPGTSVIKVSSANDDAFADSCMVNVYTEVGDVDGDGYVKIDDVVALIDYLLSGSDTGIDVANADVDFDGAVGISDVPTLIDHLLGGGSSQNERFMVNGVPFTMVRVAAGTFMMGATEEQGDDASAWEKPVHQVTLSSYLIGQTEVTQELWQAVMGTNPSLHSGSLQKPVENVSWDDCQAFIAQLNALTGQNFRMLTEAEWEYAARGGNKSLGYKYAGSNNIDDVGWVTGTTTHPVGELQPNELGLYDMSGNVDEWVWDYFGYYTSEPQTNPTGPETGDNKMYRGGSWYGGAKASRVSYRFFRVPTFKRGTMGLRLAL